MSHPAPTDAFGRPLNIGDTVIVSAFTHTTSAGLIHAQITGFSPGGQMVDLIITQVGRDQGTARNEPGMVFRRRCGRVQLHESAAVAAEITQLLAEAAAVVPETVGAR